VYIHMYIYTYVYIYIYMYISAVPLAYDRHETEGFRGKGRGIGNNLSVLCIHMDLIYTHATRGFLLAGPAKSLLDCQLSVMNVYLRMKIILIYIYINHELALSCY
jgi:hypothetical protein